MRFKVSFERRQELDTLIKELTLDELIYIIEGMPFQYKEKIGELFNDNPYYDE